MNYLIKKYKTFTILMIRRAHIKTTLLEEKWSLLIVLLLSNIISHQTTAPHSQTHRHRC